MNDVGESKCRCRKCVDARGAAAGDLLPRTVTRFTVCQFCGNKRCPHATDHAFACTGSNEPGQPGSVFA